MTYLRISIILCIALLISCKSTIKTEELQYSSAPVTQPTRFAPEIISSPKSSQFGIMFSPDGKKAYFSSRAPQEKQKIYGTNFRDGSWSTPVIEPFSTDRDETPFITSDGRYFFFGSERPIPGYPNKGNFDMNIWMMESDDDGWKDPVPLPMNINAVQEEGEEWPSSNHNLIYTADDKTFYFTGMARGRTAIELYKTEFNNGIFSDPVRVTGLFDNPNQWVYGAVISPDGQYLLFNSYGADGGQGGEDLYVSKNINGTWSKARALSTLVNTKGEESSPMFSRDGKYFFFAQSERLGENEYGEWDIMYVESEYLRLDELFKKSSMLS